MQVMAAEFSRYPGEFRCFFGEKSFGTVCFDSFILKQASQKLDVGGGF